jgi:hypothetical protein
VEEGVEDGVGVVDRLGDENVSMGVVETGLFVCVCSLASDDAGFDED